MLGWERRSFLPQTQALLFHHSAGHCLSIRTHLASGQPRDKAELVGTEGPGPGAGVQAIAGGSLDPVPPWLPSRAPAYSGALILNQKGFYPPGNSLQCLETFLVVTSCPG